MPRDVAALSDSPCEPEPPPDTPTSTVEPKPASTLPAVSPELAPLWSRVLRAEGVGPLLRAVLVNSSLEKLEGGVATLVCSPRYAADAGKKWKGSITELISREHGSPLELVIRSAGGEEAADAPIDADAETPAPPSPQPPRINTTSAADHPLVKQALELFGGRIVDIQPRRK